MRLDNQYNTVRRTVDDAVGVVGGGMEGGIPPSGSRRKSEIGKLLEVTYHQKNLPLRPL